MHEDRLAEAIVNTLQVPLLVLSDKLRIMSASRAYCETFQVSAEQTMGRHLSELGDGQWKIPDLLQQLQEIILRHSTMEEFEVDQEFPAIGRRVMRLDARKIRQVEANPSELLLVIEDVTDRRGAERDMNTLLKQKDLLLTEVQHRINNSLQIIASIILLKAKSVQSEETRRHLYDAHERVVSVVIMQNQLQGVGLGDHIDTKFYLTRLCASLKNSMLQEQCPFVIEVDASEHVVTSGDAVRLGLITTELVMNAVKHAFKNRAAGLILVRYSAAGDTWSLSVVDDGVGFAPQHNETSSGGLGTGIVEVLARQLGGYVKLSTGNRGTSVVIVGRSGQAAEAGEAPLPTLFASYG